MDPPLHYAGTESLETLEVILGASPVSKGGDSLAGSVEARSRAPEFNADGGWVLGGRVGAGYDSARDGESYAVEANTRNDRVHLRYTGGYESANDYESARGRVAATGFTNQRHSVLGAFKSDAGLFQLEAGTHRVRDAGTPVLPMDMIEDDAKRLRFAFDGETTLGTLSLAAYRHDIEHLMNNYSLRPAGAMRVEAPSFSVDTGVVVGLAQAAAGGVMKLGVEWHGNDFDAFQRNVVSLARQDMYNDATRDRTGVYAEWDGKLDTRLHLNAGVRGDFVRMDTGAIVNVNAPALADRNAFNARDRSIADNNFDATLATRYAVTSDFSVDAALARKTRSPSVLERFLYTPLASSAGQADGRTYLGNLDLEPEVAHGVSVGFSGRASGVQFKVASFYQDISDFIQGQAIARNDANGRPVLQYTNVDARLWGAEASVSTRIERVELAAWASFARGRYDVPGGGSDNLYRLAPLRGGVSADWRADGWSAGFEWLLVSRKDRVAAYNGELETAGYGVLNLRAWVEIARNVELSAGVENVFDKDYVDPLSSVNRVNAGAVLPGELIPGVGRAAQVRVNWTF
jgi:iron complex outermembrane receptor protein